MSESSEDDESNELNNKWHLVREIVTQGIIHRNLSEVDLSDADLSGANLSRALLSRPLAKITRTGKMPIPQELFFLVGWASCPSNKFMKMTFARGLVSRIGVLVLSAAQKSSADG